MDGDRYLWRKSAATLLCGIAHEPLVSPRRLASARCLARECIDLSVCGQLLRKVTNSHLAYQPSAYRGVDEMPSRASMSRVAILGPARANSLPKTSPRSYARVELDREVLNRSELHFKRLAARACLIREADLLRTVERPVRPTGTRVHRTRPQRATRTGA